MIVEINNKTYTKKHPNIMTKKTFKRFLTNLHNKFSKNTSYEGGLQIYANKNLIFIHMRYLKDEEDLIEYAKDCDILLI